MEYLVFLVLLVAGSVFFYYRSRAGGSVDDPDRSRQGLPHDLREKNVAPAGQKEVYRDIRAANRVSREEGHGKDGGG